MHLQPLGDARGGDGLDEGRDAPLARQLLVVNLTDGRDEWYLEGTDLQPTADGWQVEDTTPMIGIGGYYIPDDESAKGQEIDRVLGLELGADDYVVKPFSVRELMLRVQAVLRRGNKAMEAIEIPADKRYGWRVEEEFIGAIRGEEPVRRDARNAVTLEIRVGAAVIAEAHVGEGIGGGEGDG